MLIYFFLSQLNFIFNQHMHLLLQGLKGKQKGKRRVVKKRKRPGEDVGGPKAASKVLPLSADAIAKLEDDDSPEVCTGCPIKI